MRISPLFFDGNICWFLGSVLVIPFLEAIWSSKKSLWMHHSDDFRLRLRSMSIYLLFHLLLHNGFVQNLGLFLCISIPALRPLLLDGPNYLCVLLCLVQKFIRPVWFSSPMHCWNRLTGAQAMAVIATAHFAIFVEHENIELLIVQMLLILQPFNLALYGIFGLCRLTGLEFSDCTKGWYSGWRQNALSLFLTLVLQLLQASLGLGNFLR